VPEISVERSITVPGTLPRFDRTAYHRRRAADSRT
jgi:hypothetical protein